MKKLLFVVCIVVISLPSCDPAAQREASAANPLSPGCYEFTQNRSKISIQVAVDNETITGQLEYNFYEKDDNRGTLVGTLQGDTLFAVYTFNSEGSESRREVAFLVGDNRLTEGYGSARDVDGTLTFEDRQTVDFSSGTVLTKVDCLANGN